MVTKRGKALYLNELGYNPPTSTKSTAVTLHKVLMQNFRKREFGKIKAISRGSTSLKKLEIMPKAIQFAASPSLPPIIPGRRLLPPSIEEKFAREYKMLSDANKLNVDNKEKIVEDTLSFIRGETVTNVISPEAPVIPRQESSNVVIGFLNSTPVSKMNGKSQKAFEKMERDLNNVSFLPDDLSIFFTQRGDPEVYRSVTLNSYSNFPSEKLKAIKEKLKKSVNHHLVEMDHIKRNLSMMGKEREERATSLRKFYNSLKEGDIEDVIRRIEFDPSLLREKFSVSCSDTKQI